MAVAGERLTVPLPVERQRVVVDAIQQHGDEGLDLRHTCAAWLVSSGKVTLTEVRDLLGHSTIRMTER